MKESEHITGEISGDMHDQAGDSSLGGGGNQSEGLEQTGP